MPSKTCGCGVVRLLCLFVGGGRVYARVLWPHMSIEHLDSSQSRFASARPCCHTNPDTNANADTLSSADLPPNPPPPRE